MPNHELDAILLQIRTVALELRRLEGDGLDGLGLCASAAGARGPEVAAGRTGQPRPGARSGLATVEDGCESRQRGEKADREALRGRRRRVVRLPGELHGHLPVPEKQCAGQGREAVGVRAVRPGRHRMRRRRAGTGVLVGHGQRAIGQPGAVPGQLPLARNRLLVRARRAVDGDRRRRAPDREGSRCSRPRTPRWRHRPRPRTPATSRAHRARAGRRSRRRRRGGSSAGPTARRTRSRAACPRARGCR